MTSRLENDLLRVLRDRGPQTRSELADALGVPRTTLSTTLGALAAADVIEDGPLAASTGGRRSLRVRLSPRQHFVAVYLGERRARAAVVDGHLGILASVGVDLRDRGGPDLTWLPDIMARATAQVLGERGDPVAIGVAGAGGDPAVEAAVADRLGERFENTPIARLSAVRAMALGEHGAGAARGLDDFVTVRLGVGASMATISGGRLSGGSAGRAGEIGHLRVEEFGPACACGLTGCLDAFVGAAALVEQATDLARRGRSPALGPVLAATGALGLDDLVAAGRVGDPAITQIAHDVGLRVGRVVANTVAHVDPRRVVLTGPVMGIGAEQVLSDLRTTVYRLAPTRIAADLEVTIGELGEQGVLVGAAAAAVDLWIES